MIKTSSVALSKVESGTISLLIRAFDKVTQHINDSLVPDRARFENAENAPDNKGKSFSQELFTEYQRKLPAMKDAASEEVRKAFSQIAVTQSRKVSANDLSLELQLVSYDEMELQIILSSFENGMTRQFQSPLAMLSMRIDHICKREVPLSRLPASPVMLGYTMSSAIRQLELPLAEKKEILKALLSAIKLFYTAFLEQVNAQLVQQNVLPDLTEKDTALQQVREKQRKVAEENRKKLLGIDDKNSLQTPNEQISKFIGHLDIPAEAAQHRVSGNAAAPRISQQELASKLDAIKAPAATEDNGVYRKLDTEQSLAQQLVEKAHINQLGLSPQAAKTISLMSMVFENLLNSKNVPSPIKALLAQLQAPLLKAAVQDEMFLGDVENPAQKLFNSITEASLSWAPETNPENDALYKKMSSIVDKVSTDFEDDYLIFDEAIADFFSFREGEAQKTSQVETRIVDRETAQARLHAVRTISEQHIQKKFAPLQLPEPIKEFLTTAWKQVLFFIFNKEHSKDSVAWQDAIEIENGLLRNLVNKEHEDVEVFLIVLEEKLSDCGMQEADVRKHVDAIRETLTKTHSDIGNIVLEEEPDEETQQQQNADDEALLKDIVVGSWLQKNSQEPPLKIKVAAHIRFNDSYIMVLRNGMKENTYSRQQLLDAIKSGSMSLIKNDMLFEKALENVIIGIR